MPIRYCQVSLLVGVLLCAVQTHGSGKATPTAASLPRSAKIIGGWLEQVRLSASGRVVKAKLDSGAKTSSIHATDIEEIDRDGEPWIRFKFSESGDPGAPSEIIEAPRVRYVRIKDHDEPSSRRPSVEIEICFNGRRYRTQFTLADRSRFLYPVLLGRRFLAGAVVVDSSEKYLTTPNCPEADAAEPQAQQR